MLKKEQENLEICIDDREPKKLFTIANKWLKNKNFNHFTINKTRLKTCDLLCEKTSIGIEIKRYDSNDAKESIVDGRFPNQIIKMDKSNVKNKHYIFVGSVGDMFDTIKKYNYRSLNQIIMSYYGAMGSIQTKYKCSVNFAPNDNHCVLLAFFIFKHSALEPRSEMLIKTPRNLVDDKMRKVASLCCLKGIGEITAKKVLDGYDYKINVIKNITDVEILKKETGIGNKQAETIIKFFNQ